MTIPTQYFYGIKHAIFYNITTGVPYGVFNVIETIKFERSIENILLTGGHQDGAFAVESGEPTNTLSGTFKEHPSFAFKLFDNAEITNIDGEVDGFVGSPSNIKGSSILSTGGISSITAIAGSENNLPLGKISVEATDTNRVKVSLIGASKNSRIEGNQSVIIEDLEVITDGIVELVDYGFTITFGSGPIDLVIGDTMEFETRPSNGGVEEIVVGKSSIVKEFGLMLIYPKQSNGSQTIVDFFKVSSAGMSFGGETRAFSSLEQSMTPLMTDRGLYKKTEIQPTI